jgi:DNA uptake protein ComE-like DNA-binding protein
MAVIFIRFIMPDREYPIEEITLNIPESIVETKEYRPETVHQSTRSGKASYLQNRPKIELNTCDSASLESLPGLGPVLSARIIRYRNLLGGFASVKQLREVYGLPEETFNLVSGRLTADSLLIKKININTADFKQLIRLPYIDRYDVNSILKYRELKGRIEDINELVDNKLVTKEKFMKVRSYLKVK